jgi:hypothetical protein
MENLKLMKKLLLITFIFVQTLAFSQVQYGTNLPVASTVNSSTATLTSGSVFTGTSENVLKYAEIRVSVFSDVASATDGLSMQQSKDGTNWDFVNAYTVPASTGKEFGVGVSATFFRIVYTNGGTNQATFRLAVSYHGTVTKASSVRPQDLRANDNDMEESLSYNMTYDPATNTWSRMQGPGLVITGQSAQTATVNNIIPATAGSTGTSTAQFSFGSIQVISTGTSGTFIFEFANADGNYQTMPVYNNALLTGTPITVAITATSSNLIYYFPITTNFIRLRINTTIAGGSIQALTRLSAYSPSPNITTVAQPTAANLNVTAAIAATQTLSTVTTVGTVTTLANGQTAHSSASTGSPVRDGGRVAPATPDLTLAAGDASDLMISNGQQLVTKPFAPDIYDWQFAITAPAATTSDVVVKTAAGASLRNYITGCQIINSSATIATEIVLKDGATVIWRGYVGTSALLNSVVGVTFFTPLRGTANTAVNFACITTASSVYISCQGFIAP